GTGFKAPTVFQLFDTFSGNPNLKPEQSQGWDYGIDQPILDGRMVLSGTYFHNNYTNLIMANAPAFVYFNVNRAASSGFEFAATWNLNASTTITANYTKLETVDESTGLKLLRRPDDRATINVNRRMLNNRANANLQVLYVGDRDDVFFPDGFTTVRVVNPNYIIVNVAGSYN